jgi:beta-glucanase (GH16 family)
MEWLGNGPNTIYLTLHYGANNSQQEGIVNISGLSSGFHRFGVLWTPTSVVWYIDGIQKYSTTTGVPTKDMFVVLNNDTGGWNGNAVDKSTVFPAILSIDYVAVWAPPGG